MSKKGCMGCDVKEMSIYEFVENVPMSHLANRIINIKNNNVDGHVFITKNNKEFSTIFYCPWCGRKLSK